MGRKSRIRLRLSVLRDRLRDYGVTNSESLLAAVTRLADEHRSAVADASQAKEQAATWKAAAELASQTRDGAQLLATNRHTEAQGLRLENRQLRAEIEALRRRIIEEGNRAE